MMPEFGSAEPGGWPADGTRYPPRIAAEIERGAKVGCKAACCWHSDLELMAREIERLRKASIPVRQVDLLQQVDGPCIAVFANGDRLELPEGRWFTTGFGEAFLNNPGDFDNRPFLRSQGCAERLEANEREIAAWRRARDARGEP